MRKRRNFFAMFQIVAVAALWCSANAAGQGVHAVTPVSPQQISEKDVADLQDQLLKLVRLSPTLAEVVAHDPSLLSNADYVNRTNPELGRFLQEHPDIAHNPDFYLFNNLHGHNERSADTLERKLWPPHYPEPQNHDIVHEIFDDGAPLLGFISFLAALLWLIHVLLENRRWNRIFKLQSDVHGRLIERFGTSQEVLTYMQSEAGKKFLEASPIAVGFEQQEKLPSPVARVLTPLQIGVVMTLLGLGLIMLRHSVSDSNGLVVLGTIILTPGLGFIISAGITWVLAKRLGLIPESGAQH
jgi:hypothetical protein